MRAGDWVELTSRYGEVRVQAVVTDAVKGKELYMPMNSTDEPVNRLTSSHTDKVTHTPAYKETSVQMTVLPEQGENPLPRTNSRFGHPTPQTGVEVERKWKRADYHEPGNGLVVQRQRLVRISTCAHHREHGVTEESGNGPGDDQRLGHEYSCGQERRDGATDCS